jgi:hypothetical protein
MDGQAYGCMDETVGQTYGLTYGRTYGWTDGRMGSYTSRLQEKQTERLILEVDRLADEQTDIR